MGRHTVGYEESEYGVVSGTGLCADAAVGCEEGEGVESGVWG